MEPITPADLLIHLQTVKFKDNKRELVERCSRKERPKTCLARLEQQHYCKILGSRHCYKCERSLQRKKSADFAANYPSTMRLSEKNLATAILAAKNLPKEAPESIEDGVARGEISPATFPIAHLSKRRSYSAKPILSSKNDSVKNGKESYAFFTNIRDLNCKLTSGLISEELLPQRIKKKATLYKNPFPSFISCRKTASEESEKKNLFFEPPLLPRVSQNAEPSFFAGSADEYKLPERLPDNIES
ncbi:DgyrCDS3409 [Dimorphilus gyrociliatus]|uniref:DgyrCDS3409 n=1 Tax=Dimorphilus gyrociliatus TaxID=2664684 RepID=A0A7I8VG53_9ANNE|nr:DgyrCDS3409 [Dimorphilus gyrociliatus]